MSRVYDAGMGANVASFEQAFAAAHGREAYVRMHCRLVLVNRLGRLPHAAMQPGTATRPQGGAEAR